ncbi:MULTISPECIES: hypothetical protein [unclassified Mycolicibacterium]|uniref:hypothetical protein n=1 Tax=unclassified Mycolicibacterium TaxID=2636767 RepID=UPI001EE3FC98|nr:MULTISPECIES: hypothetical protein [unclassified Mycolicibacterium]
MAKRPAPVRGGNGRGGPDPDPRRRTAVRPRRGDEPEARRDVGKRDAKRDNKTGDARVKRGKRDVGPQRSKPTGSGPQTTPFARPTAAPSRPKSASQAKARAKARKAKAPKVIRMPLRERLLIRIAEMDLNPRRLIARVPFVVLIIGALGMGLGITLWLSTSAAERSYELGRAKEINQALQQQKEALERDVLVAQAAPALADAARNLGMIPSRDTAHLVQDPSGNWQLVGSPKPAQGVPPPPLNAPLADPAPAAAPAAVPAPPAPRVVDPREQVVREPDPAAPVLPVPAVPVPGAPAPALAAPLPLPVPAAVPVPAAPAPAAVPVPAAPAAPILPVPGLGTLPGPAQVPAAVLPVQPAPGAPA